jgi:hypothetical protein
MKEDEQVRPGDASPAESTAFLNREADRSAGKGEAMRKIEKGGLGHLKKLEKKNRLMIAGRAKALETVGGAPRTERRPRRRCA